MECGGRRTSAKACAQGGADELGGRMDQGRCGSGLAEAHATPGISGLATPLGSGTLFRLDLPQQEDEQGLREAVRNRRSVRVRSHHPPYGKAVGLLMRLFHTVSEDEFSEV